MSMLQHPLSRAFPLPTPAEFNSLRDDIRDHGQRHPIIIYQGMVLDGWTRFRACAELGKDPFLKEYGGNDPVGYVLSSNLHRRHLSASQRAGAIVACYEWRQRGGNQKAIGNVTDCSPTAAQKEFGNVTELKPTAAQMAEAAHVSEKTIVDAKTAHNAGFEEAMRDRKTTASEAANLARKAPEVAARVVAKEITPAQGKAELKERETKPKRELPTVPGPDLSAELDRMDAQLMDMRAELIELRAASMDECLRNQARDEILEIRDALALALQRAADADALLGDAKFKILELQKHNAWLERKLRSP